jgi:hypothetical protein
MKFCDLWCLKPEKPGNGPEKDDLIFVIVNLEALNELKMS